MLANLHINVSRHLLIHLYLELNSLFTLMFLNINKQMFSNYSAVKAEQYYKEALQFKYAFLDSAIIYKIGINSYISCHIKQITLKFLIQANMLKYSILTATQLFHFSLCSKIKHNINISTRLYSMTQQDSLIQKNTTI